MHRNHPLAQTIPERPVLELACSTWMAFDRLYRKHIVPCHMVLPPSAAPSSGPVLVTIKLPSGDLLRLDATVGRVFYDDAGHAIGTELKFQELSPAEMKNLSRYAARLERGWSVPPLPRVASDPAPASGIRCSDKES